MLDSPFQANRHERGTKLFVRVQNTVFILVGQIKYLSQRHCSPRETDGGTVRV